MFAEFFNLPKARPIHALTLGYILALFIIAWMSLVIHYGIGEIIKQQNNRDVIYASRQLKLIPLIYLNTRDYIDVKDDVMRQRTLDNIESLKLSHDQLFSKEQLDKTRSSKTFFSVQVEESQSRAMHDIESFIRNSESFFNASPENISKNNKNFLAIKSLMQGSLLQNVDSINIAYEAESLEYIRKLQTYQYVALIIILITLLLEALFIFMPLVRRVKIYAKTLEDLARTDSLTGIDNRRSVMEKGEKEIGRAKRYKKPLAVGMIDIDHFKIINDQHGHITGDMILKEIVENIKNNIRLEDEVGRYGGEEFIVLLPTTGVDEALIVLERVRSTVEAKEYRTTSGEYIKVTISAGIATVDLDSERELDPAIRRADVMLYKAKEAGRNQIKIFK